MGSLFITIYMSQMWPDDSSVGPAVSSCSCSGKVGSRLPESFSHALVLSQQYRTCFLLLLLLLNSVSPLLSINVSSPTMQRGNPNKDIWLQCEQGWKGQHWSRVLYPQGMDIILLILSKLTLGLRFMVDRFRTFRHSTPSRRIGLGKASNGVNTCSYLHLTIFKKIMWPSGFPPSLPNFQGDCSRSYSNEEL